MTVISVYSLCYPIKKNYKNNNYNSNKPDLNEQQLTN